MADQHTSFKITLRSQVFLPLACVLDASKYDGHTQTQVFFSAASGIAACVVDDDDGDAY
jgi:hypothetical protein